jgi:flavin reductase (DIM6/NTAB) family NADH-FMN oxidoreductase RutF
MSPTDAETVFSLLDPEIWLLTARVGNRQGGLVATLVSQASIVPDGPRVWVGLSPQHHTTGLVRKGESFLLHLVREAHFDLVYRFGTRSGHDEDKFADGAWERSELGHPRLADAVAWMECEVESFASTGDRLHFLGRVKRAKKLSDEPPLTLSKFRSMQSPAQAAEIERRLVRDGWIDADLIRRWNDAGYQPIAITKRGEE